MTHQKHFDCIPFYYSTPHAGLSSAACNVHSIYIYMESSSNNANNHNTNYQTRVVIPAMHAIGTLRMK